VKGASMTRGLSSFRRILASMTMIFSFGCAATMKEMAPLVPKEPTLPPAHKKSPGSIWPGETYFNTLFTDSKARRPGDIVTIKVVEISSASKEATTSTGRDSSLFAGINNFFGIAEANINPLKTRSLDASKLINAKSSASFKGSGKTTRSGTLTASISAIVTDVLPNGNLVIEGRKRIIVNNEEQIFILRGIVRPEDISPNNEVLSTAIANTKIVYTGVGIIADKQRPGWLTRIFDKVWPF